jgi:hypothetical protein
MLVAIGGHRQVPSLNGAGPRGYDAADGNPLWLHPWVTQGNQMANVAQSQVVASGVVSTANDGLVFVFSAAASVPRQRSLAGRRPPETEGVPKPVGTLAAFLVAPC